MENKKHNNIEILVTNEAPIPLKKDSITPSEFPIDVLPGLVKQGILALHEKIQAPMAICAQSVLSALNLAVQGHADIKLPMGQIRPISCFFLTIAESGERKSSCDNELLKVIEEYEAELNCNYGLKCRVFDNKLDAWKKVRKDILKRSKDLDPNSIQSKLDAIGSPPFEPLIPLIICPEPTYEGLCKLMVKAQPSLGIFSSEGGQFIGGYGLKEENKISTVAGLSSIWDGKAIKRIRAGDEKPLIINGKRLSMHLMVQPNIANRFLSDPTLKDQGILSRFLVSAPLSTAGTRFHKEFSDVSENYLNQLLSRLRAIFNTPLPIKDESHNDLQPRAIELSPESIDVYNEFVDCVESKIAPRMQYEPIKGFANKLPEHASRLALTLALTEDILTEKLEVTYLKQGIAIGKYYADELLRLQNEGVIDQDLLLAEKLLYWMLNTWSENNISLPDIYQRSLNAIRTKKDALRIVKILEDHNWLIPNDQNLTINGSKRIKSWRIVKP